MEELHAYVAGRTAAKASFTLARIRKAINRLDPFPHSGRLGTVEGTRELIVARLPYRIICQIIRDQVVIERVLHTSQQWPPPSQDLSQP